MNRNYREEAQELIKNGYDLHTHTEPSAFPRALNDLELIQEAEAAQMAGVMIKAHYDSTTGRAGLVNMISCCRAKAYGGLVLNHPTGGLNPYSVENAARTGAVIIWMPTRDSANCLAYGDMPGDFFKRPGITIFDEEKRIKKEVFEIFEIVKKYDIHLATGHLSTEESVALCREGRKHKVKMILTHPEWIRTKIAGDIQVDMASIGVLIEKNWLNLSEGSVSIEEMASNIRMAGTSQVYLATDRGQKGFEHPVEGMLRFIEVLLTHGFTHGEIKEMVETVPSQIVK